MSNAAEIARRVAEQWKSARGRTAQISTDDLLTLAAAVLKDSPAPVNNKKPKPKADTR